MLVLPAYLNGRSKREANPSGLPSVVQSGLPAAAILTLTAIKMFRLCRAFLIKSFLVVRFIGLTVR